MLIESFHFGDDVSCYWRICLIMVIRKNAATGVQVCMCHLWTGLDTGQMYLSNMEVSGNLFLHITGLMILSSEHCVNDSFVRLWLR